MSTAVSHFGALLLAAASVLPVAGAQATVLDFDTVTPGLFDAGDSFTEGAYTWTVNGSYGAVDTVAGCFIATCPSNNATQFYQGYNDTHVSLRRTDGTAFSLVGFDAAFIAPVPLAAGLSVGRIQFIATGANGTLYGNSDFAPTVADGSVPFIAYTPGPSAGLAHLLSVDFFACTFDDGGSCLNPSANQAQFALDNVSVTAVPEPASLALMGLGLGALGWLRRRNTRQSA